MSSTPRTRSIARVLFALLVSAVLLIAFLFAIGFGTNPSAAVQSVIDSFFPPAAVTEQGAAIRDLYTIVFLIAVVIFFLVEGLIIWTVLRYRRRPGDDSLPPQTHGNMLAEVLWTVIPTVIVAFLFVISWQTLNTVEAVSNQPDVKIRAVAGQFQWTFDYMPDDWTPEQQDATPLYTEFVPTGERPEDGGMAVPAGENVQLYLTSPDVIHAFYVPQFLYKRDVVPGRTNVFDFRVNTEDAGQTFRGQCAELCGAGHRVMLFDVHALAPADFEAWLAAKIEGGSATPPPAEPGASGEPGEPGGGMGDTVIELVAVNVAFDLSELTVPAGEGFRIEFDNQDAGTPHNVAIHEGSPTGPEIWKGEIFNGPEKRTYEVPALAAGTYGFVCTVHPNMTGTLTAE